MAKTKVRSRRFFDDVIEIPNGENCNKSCTDCIPRELFRPGAGLFLRPLAQFLPPGTIVGGGGGDVVQVDGSVMCTTFSRDFSATKWGEVAFAKRVKSRSRLKCLE